MSIVMMLPMTAAEEGPGLMPYAIGVGSFVLLLAALLGILAFGKGREHS